VNRGCAALLSLMVVGGCESSPEPEWSCVLTTSTSLGPALGKGAALLDGGRSLYVVNGPDMGTVPVDSPAWGIVSIADEHEEMWTIPWLQSATSISAAAGPGEVLHVFWVVPVDEGSEEGQALYTAAVAGGNWTEPQRVTAVRRVGRDGISSVVALDDGTLHVGASATEGGVLRPTTFTLVNASMARAELAGNGAYLRFAAVGSGAAAAFVSASREPVRGEKNAVWVSQWGNDGWARAVRVSSGATAAAEFEPQLIAHQGLHVFWTRDLNGDPLTREGLYYSVARTRASRWSLEQRLDSAWHISAVHATTIRDQPVVVYLRSHGLAGPSEFMIARPVNNGVVSAPIPLPAQPAGLSATGSDGRVLLLFRRGRGTYEGRIGTIHCTGSGRG
jgi:hypothetical protein